MAIVRVLIVGSLSIETLRLRSHPGDGREASLELEFSDRRIVVHGSVELSQSVLVPVCESGGHIVLVVADVATGAMTLPEAEE